MSEKPCAKHKELLRLSYLALTHIPPITKPEKEIHSSG